MTDVPPRDLITPTCPICADPVYADQGFYSITKAHWTCHEASTLSDRELNEITLGGRRRRPEGEGATAQRAKKLAVAALEAAVGAPLEEVTLWNQQGAYRGPKWDLDAWGLDFTFLRDRDTIRGSASSLATMTACVRDCAHGGRLIAQPSGDLAFSYDLMAETRATIPTDPA